MFNISLFEELTVVNSLSGVSFLVIVVSLVWDMQANLGRGKFITGFLETELNLDVKTLDKSASLEEDTSLELWSSIL